MKRLTIFLLAFSAFVLLGRPASAQHESSQISFEATASDTDGIYGERPSIDAAEAMSVSAAVADSSVHGRTVLVAGTIEDVCQKKGCWMVISDGERSMRVTFKDYGFFVPIDATGRDAIVEGIVSREEISEEVARHYAEESKSEDPEQIDGPQQVVTMIATGVRFESSR